MLFEELDRIGRVQLRLDDQRAAEHRRDEQPVDQSRGERQRQHQQRGGAGPETFFGEGVLQHDRQQRPVGEHHTLRQARRTTGEQYRCGFVGGHIDTEIIGRPLTDRVEFGVGDDGERVTDRHGVLGELLESGCHEDHTDPGVVGDLAQFGRLVAAVQRDQHTTGLERGERSDRPGQRIGPEQPHPVPLRNTLLPDEQTCDPAAPVTDLPVIQGLPTENQRGAIGCCSGPPIEGLADGCGHLLISPVGSGT